MITYEDWLTMPTVEDGTDEVVKGEYRFMPPTLFWHGRVERTAILVDGDLQPTRFPGVSIPIASIWPEER